MEFRNVSCAYAGEPVMRGINLGIRPRAAVAVVGKSGSGKSTLGTFVADRLGWPCLDIDRGIEARCGMTLTDFYRIDPVAFRDMAPDVVLEICRRDPTALSFDAGPLMKAETRRVSCRAPAAADLPPPGRPS